MQVRKNINFKPVNNLPEVLIVRNIRNECRNYLTNYTKYISLIGQIWWYFTYYRQASHAGIYRIFLARDKGKAIGFGALRLSAGKLLVTECIASEYRGQGYGFAILKKLMEVAQREKLPLIAEIRSSNTASIALHTKCGFIPDTTKVKSGNKLLIYVYR
jgi:RimJ/RimL family protein N-acetyltransferase